MNPFINNQIGINEFFKIILNLILKFYLNQCNPFFDKINSMIIPENINKITNN